MTRTRFADWKPLAGDLALVPGGPANARYVAALSELEASQIRSGKHGGYLPLEFYVFAGQPKPLEYPTHCRWNDKRRAWDIWITGVQNKYIHAGEVKTLAQVYYKIRREEWQHLEWRVTNRG